MTSKTSDLCDGCEAALACALPFLGYGRRRGFAGTIRSIRCHEDIPLMRDVVGQPGCDQVLVIDGGGSLARALFGDVMAGMAVRNGWAGLVINGVIRDAVEIDAMDIGVKALGTVPRRGERTGAGEVDVPVHFGGIIFTPGHRLVADEDGVIVLPAGIAEGDIAVDDVRPAPASCACFASMNSRRTCCSLPPACRRSNTPCRLTARPTGMAAVRRFLRSSRCSTSARRATCGWCC